MQSGANASSELPVAPDPALIPTTGVSIYDEISRDMADNPPFQNDSAVAAKFETIGIGPGKTPSTQTNETIRQTLENGIVEGEKLIDARIQKLGEALQNMDYSLTLQWRLFIPMHSLIVKAKN